MDGWMGDTDGGDADGWRDRGYGVKLEGYSVALRFDWGFPT